ncbi:hypothetical protein GCM10010270_08510 [Streptomyces violaceus]|nr:hypothetical protein GCM10010270_08510 [Streptomyces janthinus]
MVSVSPRSRMKPRASTRLATGARARLLLAIGLAVPQFGNRTLSQRLRRHVGGIEELQP